MHCIVIHMTHFLIHSVVMSDSLAVFVCVLWGFFCVFFLNVGHFEMVAQGKLVSQYLDLNIMLTEQGHVRMILRMRVL